MTPDDVAKILVENADNGDYFFRTETELFESVEPENAKYVKSYFVSGELFPALSKLGWAIEPWTFKDHEEKNVNFSNHAITKLVETGGRPSGYRLTIKPNTQI